MNYQSLNNKDSLKAWIYRIASSAITGHSRRVQTVALLPGHYGYVLTSFRNTGIRVLGITANGNK